MVEGHNCFHILQQLFNQFFAEPPEINLYRSQKTVKKNNFSFYNFLIIF